MQVALKDKSVRTRIITYNKYMHIHIIRKDSDLFTSAGGIDVVYSIYMHLLKAIGLFEQVFKTKFIELLTYCIPCMPKKGNLFPTDFINKLAYIDLIFK
jgi:hypothetical protein